MLKEKFWILKIEKYEKLGIFGGKFWGTPSFWVKNKDLGGKISCLGRVGKGKMRKNASKLGVKT